MTNTGRQHSRSQETWGFLLAQPPRGTGLCITTDKTLRMDIPSSDILGKTQRRIKAARDQVPAYEETADGLESPAEQGAHEGLYGTDALTSHIFAAPSSLALPYDSAPKSPPPGSLPRFPEVVSHSLLLWIITHSPICLLRWPDCPCRRDLSDPTFHPQLLSHSKCPKNVH